MSVNDPIRGNRIPILLVSAAYLLGAYYSWQRRQGEAGFEFNPLLGVLTVSLCGLILGMILSQRTQQLGSSRPLAHGWAASWRVALAWVGLAMLAESLKTDATVTFTLHILSPWIFLGSASILMSSFFVSYVGRIRKTDSERVTVLTFLSKLSGGDKIAAASVVVAIAGLAWTVLEHRERDVFPLEKRGENEGAIERATVLDLAKDEGQRQASAARKQDEDETGASDPPDPSVQDLRADPVLALEAIKPILEDAGYSTMESFVGEPGGSLSDDGEHVVFDGLTLVAGTEYVFVGACDARCRDLDLYLYSVTGGEEEEKELVAEDNFADSLPVIRFAPQADGAYQLHANMYECGDEEQVGAVGNGAVPSCAWAVRAYAR